MTSPGFLEGALVGLIAAVAGSVVHLALGFALPAGAALTLVIAGLGLGYGLYLLARSREHAGRVVIVTLWVTATALSWAVSPGPWTQLLVQSGLVWLVRSLYHQPTPLAALLDLALIAGGLAAALWAGVHTGSLLLALWCLFLVQALFGAIPDLLPVKAAAATGSDLEPDPFDIANRAAQSALSRLSKHSAL